MAAHATGGNQANVALVREMRAQQLHAAYPLLFAGPSEQEGGLAYQRQRAHTGLQTIAVRHDALSEHQLRSLGRFRLHQYVLCGFYDPEVIFERGIRTDPALRGLPAGTVHFLVGTAEGQFPGL